MILAHSKGDLWSFSVVKRSRSLILDHILNPCLPLDSDLSRMDVLGRITGAGVEDDMDMSAEAEAAEDAEVAEVDYT